MAAALALTPRSARSWMLGAALAGLAASVKVSGGMVAVGVIVLGLPAGADLFDRAGAPSRSPSSPVPPCSAPAPSPASGTAG